MNRVKSHLLELFERYPCLKVCENDIWNAFNVIKESYQNDGKLMIAGNGGSAADSEHIVGELMKAFVKPRTIDNSMQEKLKKVDVDMGNILGKKIQGALPAIALVDHVALSTAYLNDMDPLLGFAQQLYGYGKKEDTFLAISTSGNSQNILYACIVAKAKGIRVVGLTGKDGGRLKNMCDVAIVVPESETFKIQELHLPVYHCMCLMLEEEFF